MLLIVISNFTCVAVEVSKACFVDVGKSVALYSFVAVYSI